MLKHNKLLPPLQFEFRNGRSSSDSLAILSTELHTAMAMDAYSACLFHDIKGVLNYVIPFLVTDMINLGISKKRKFIYNLTSNRQVFFQVNDDERGPSTFKKGLNQFCISSSTLYTIYKLGLHRVLHSLCKILECADDACSSIRYHKFFTREYINSPIPN